MREYCDSEGCHCGPRQFMTKEEKIKSLKEYQELLEKESQGVKERIEELKKK